MLVVPLSSIQKQRSQTKTQRPRAACLCGDEVVKERCKAGKKKWMSLHDGSVNDGLDVVLSVSRVDDPLPFGVLFDVGLCEELKTHV